MIEIKFDSANETVFIEHLKQLITENPILLQNIIEPSVNGLISDANVPQVIKDKVSEAYEAFKTETSLPDRFKIIIEEIIDEAFHSEIGDPGLRQALTDYFESESFKSMVQHELEDISVEDQVSTAVDNFVDGAISRNGIDEIINEKVDDLIESSRIDIEEKVDEAIDEKIEEAHVDIEGQTRDSVDEKVDATLPPILERLVAEKLAALPQDQLFEGRPNITPELLQAIRTIVAEELDKKNIKAPASTEYPNVEEWDTVILKCRTDATTSLVWMLQNFVNQNAVIIQQAGVA